MESRSLVAFCSTVGAEDIAFRVVEGGPCGGNRGENIFGEGVVVVEDVVDS